MTSSCLRLGRELLVALGVMVLLLAWSTASLAEQHPAIDGVLTDDADLLDAADEEAVLDAFAVVEDEVRLHLVTMDTTGGAEVTGFTRDVAEENGLSGRDALLLIAIDDRAYSVWVADGLTAVSDPELEAITTNVTQPQLAAGDFAQAAIDTANALADAQVGSDVAPEPTPETPAAPSTEDGGSGGRTPWWILIVLAVGVWAAIAWWRERRGRRRSAEERDRQLGELARHANARLLASDEALREMATELGFAEARFHPDDVAPFAAALEAARKELHDAFAIRQRLDEDPPQDPAQRAGSLEAIVEHTTRIDHLLTVEHERLETLRDVEQRAPELLAAARDQRESLLARLAAVGPLHDRLMAASPSARVALDGNLAEAKKHLANTDGLIVSGLQAAEAGRAPEAARTLRGVETSLAASDRLIGAVERANAELDEAEQTIDEVLRTAASGLDAARDALADAPQIAVATPDEAPAGPTSPDTPTPPSPPSSTPPGTGPTSSSAPPPPPSPSQILSEGQSSLAEARAHRDGDVLRAYGLARAAESAANEVLAIASRAHQRQEQAVAAATSALQAATAAHALTEDFLEARRRGIGREARTRLQEAERHLSRARELLTDQPTVALRHAREAERLAGEAYQLAQEDFHAYDDLRGPFGRGPFGGGGGGTILIGGIPIPLGGGRRGGGGFGGSVWGSPGGRSSGGGFGGGIGGRGIGGGFGGRGIGGGFGGGRGRGGGF